MTSFPRIASLTVMILGLLVLAGWGWDVATLKTVFPGLASMKANTAVAFVLGGLSLRLQASSDSAPGRHLLLARAAAALILGLGLLTLVEYLTRLDFGIDQILFLDAAIEPQPFFPGRMSPASAVNFVLLGVALLCFDTSLGQRPRWPAQYCAFASAGITMLAFIGYFYGVETLYQIAPFTTIGLHTVVAFWLLCLGILLARPTRGVMMLFTSDRPGSVVVRRMLPTATAMVLLTGWLRVLGQRAGYYGLGFGSALFATVLILSLALLAAWIARELNRIDDARQNEAQALSRSRARLDGIISSAMDAVISVNAQQQVVLFNPAAEKMFGVQAVEALGQQMDKFIPHRFRAAHSNHINAFSKTNVSVRQMGALGAVSALRADGEEFPVEASISQIDSLGEKLFTVILRDVTERQKTEASLVESERREHSRRVELEALMEVVPAVVWIAHDPECKRITGNLTGQQILHVPAGRNVSRTAPEQERPQNFQVFRQGAPVPDAELPMQLAGRQGCPVLSQELELRFDDGSSRWIYGNAVPLVKTDGTARGVVGAFVDITKLKEAQEELRLSRENLRGLAARLQQVREEERTRVAREIHDVLAQELTRLKVDILWLTRRLNPVITGNDLELIRVRLTGMGQVTDAAIESVQKIASELRPVVLDTLGLCAAIEWQATEFEARTGIKCELNLPAADLVLEREHATALFRILQESLTNVVRHARATQVEIDLQSDETQTTLAVRDNGQGIASNELNDPHSLGLLGMRERAMLLGGECNINGQPGIGTEVEARLPFKAPRGQKEPRS